VAWWSHIIFVSACHGRLLLLHLFWMIVLLGWVSWGWSYSHSVPGRSHPRSLKCIIRFIPISYFSDCSFITYFKIRKLNVFSFFLVLLFL
jgi:hypothetical protein